MKSHQQESFNKSFKFKQQKSNQKDQKERISQIQCVFQDMFSSQKGNIFISNYQAASNIKILKENNIKAILSYAIGTLLPHTKQEIPNYLYIPAQDSQEYQLKNDYELAFEFIEKNRKKTNVLIHCVSGKSRCTAILIFYLMKKYQYNCSQALDMIKRSKPNTKPNLGFLKQLNQLNRQINGKYDKKIEELIKKVEIDKEKSQKKYNRNNTFTNQIQNVIISISPQKKKTLSLVVDKLKAQNSKIQDHIFQVIKTIQNHQNRKRTKSQYLRKRLQQARQKSLKKGEISGLTNTNQQQPNYAEVNDSKKVIKYKNSSSYRIDILNKKYGMDLNDTGVRKKIIF